MITLNPSRRRFLGIVASAGALASTSWMARKALASTEVPTASWRGIALGADAELHIYHPDRRHAQRLVQQAVTEVHRLERVFSLYQPDSTLATLNRDGRLADAPTDMLRLLEASHRYSRMTDGIFDPTVQALWKLHADAIHAGTGTPSDNDIATALQRVDYRGIAIDRRTIELARPGMMLTLNGIAQGYITDRVVELLRDAGLDHALVDMGEIRCLNRNEANRAFRVGLAGDSDDRHPLQTLQVRNRAVSTSAGRGTLLDAQGQVTHLFNPQTGSARPRYRSVSVMAGDATTADALSTAFSMMPETDIARVVNEMGAQAWVLHNDAQSLVAIG